MLAVGGAAAGSVVLGPRIPQADDEERWLEELDRGSQWSFANVRDAGLPRAAAGVYTVYRGPEFIYVGIAGRQQTAKSLADHEAAKGKVKGLADRLRSHASAR